jgi:hypothetical protein
MQSIEDMLGPPIFINDVNTKWWHDHRVNELLMLNSLTQQFSAWIVRFGDGQIERVLVTEPDHEVMHSTKNYNEMEIAILELKHQKEGI